MNESNTAMKLRGLPFEPEQIISTLKEHPQVSQASTNLVKDNKGRNILIAFVVLKESNAASVIELRSFARSKLYPQLVPDFFIIHSEEQKPDLNSLKINMMEQGFHPHRDATDILLLEIWTELLEKAVGIDDDFFAEGGHSLLAVDLLSRIEKATGQSLPLSTMLTNTTIRALTDALVHGGAPAVEGEIIELQKGRGDSPLFFLHGDYTGGGFFSRKIAQNADLDAAFLIVQPYGLGRTQDLELPDSMEAMAAAHLKQIRLKQPSGPYKLAGHCNAAIIAFEIAQQLLKSGEKVEFLGMIDPPKAHQFPNDRLQAASTDTNNSQEENTDKSTTPLNEEEYRRWLLGHYLRLSAVYVASDYNDPVSLIVFSQKSNDNSTSGWDSVAKNIAVHRIDAKTHDHLAAIQQNAGTIGKILCREIARVQEQ